MKSLDIGQSYSDVAMPASPEKEKKHYPNFTYDGAEELGLPKEGTMTVSFRTIRESHSEDENGKKRYSCTIEVRSIDDVEGAEGESPTHSYNDSEDALDKLMEEKMKKMKSRY